MFVDAESGALPSTQAVGQTPPVVRQPADELRNQLQNILAVAGDFPNVRYRGVHDRVKAQEAIETAVSTIMEKVAPALTDEGTE